MRRIVICLLAAVIAVFHFPAPARAQAANEPLSWLDVTPPLRYRSYADLAVELGWLSKQAAYGPFATKQYKKGDSETFYALDFLATRDRKMKATLELVTDHAYWWFEEGAKPTNTDALVKAAERFEKDIYPLDHKLFGSEASPGVDGDPRIYIMNQKKIGGYAVGVFSPWDQCPIEVCRTSNQRDMIYVGLDYAPIGSVQSLTTIAHEFQHLIQYTNDGDEQRWLDEGLAQLAEHLNGFEPRYISGNSTRLYLNNTNVQLNSWPASAETDPSVNYAMGYMFSVYLYQRFGTPFVQFLARSPYKGLSAVAQTLKEFNIPLTLDQVFHEWAITNYVNSPYPGSGQYYYQSLKLSSRPLTQTLTNSVAKRVNLKNYAAGYYVIDQPGNYTLSFRGENSEKVGPPAPPSGESMWWSFNDTHGMARLEREIDLTNARRATLTFKTWYDMPTDQNIGMVLASKDGGANWTPLRGSLTERCETRLYCYQGRSNGWEEESVSLAAYAGKKVLIRFQYVTEPGEQRVGWFLDDIAVADANFADDAETRVEGWQTDGFIRVPQAVPVHWAVTAIDRADATKMQAMQVNDNGDGTLTLTVGKSGAVVAVTGTAPFTYGSATFSLTAKTG